MSTPDRPALSPRERVERLRDKLARKDSELSKLGERIGLLEAAVARAREDAAEARAHTKKRSRSIDKLHRKVPGTAAMRSLFPLRYATFPPAPQAAAAALRERAFAAAAPVYTQPHPIDEDDVMVDVEGVRLCLPAKNAHKIDLPWGTIQAIREFTVGGIMLDIGANVGQTSLPRVVLGDFQAVYAAEADPVNYARLHTAVAANRAQGFVMPDRVAIGSRDGVLRFRHSGGYRSLSPAAEDDTRVIDVPCVTLDSWIARLGVDPREITFVKTDTNGFELEVLRGAQALLALRLAVWQVEVAPTFMARYGTGLDELAAELGRHFSYFFDQGGWAVGARVRPIGEFSEALAYLATRPVSPGGKPGMTDVVCFNGAPAMPSSA